MIANVNTTVTINSSQIVHWGSEFGTMCGAGAGFGKKIKDSQAATATCKRCVKLIALQVELAHAEALEQAVAVDVAQAPRELDIWLTEGTVLVDPVTGDLMTFERWGSKGAQLRNQRTGAQHVVGQSNVVTWKYIPRPVEWNQVWRERATGVLVRIVDMAANSVRLRGMEPEERPFWLGKDLLAELYVWVPESGAEGFTRTAHPQRLPHERWGC